MPAQPPTHIDLPPAPGANAGSGALAPAADVQMDENEHNDNEDQGEDETSSAARPAPPRGILKNAFRRPSYVGAGELSPATDAERVQWDEANIAETEIGKDSLMKIDEPKTPFVRYDAENDLVLDDVPEFNLQAGAAPRSPASTGRGSAPQTPTSDRRPSISSTRSGSGSSSRSASFSLPSKDHPVRPGRAGSSSSPRHQTAQLQGDGLGLSGTDANGADGSAGSVPLPQSQGPQGIALGATSANTAANSGQGEVFSDSDEEMDEEAKQRHKEFKGKRQAHYSNEAALALKRAKELAAAEDAEEEETARVNGD